MIGSRTFGTEQQSRASKMAGAMQYLVVAPKPTTERLIALFGMRPNEAQRMLDAEMQRRARGSASVDLLGLFGG